MQLPVVTTMVPLFNAWWFYSRILPLCEDGSGVNVQLHRAWHTRRRLALGEVLVLLVSAVAWLGFATTTSVASALPSAVRWNDSICATVDQVCLTGDVDGDGDADVVEFNKTGASRGKVRVGLS
ncbi:hypothetical protein ABT272_43495, partial [Streptomyces sp900105245]